MNKKQTCQQKRTIWPFVIGGISISWGTLGILLIALTVGNMYTVLFSAADSTRLHLTVMSAAVLCYFGLSVASGAALVSRRRNSRGISLAYAWVGLIFGGIFVLLGDIETPIATVFLIMTLGYSTFQLLWFWQDKISSEMARW